MKLNIVIAHGVSAVLLAGPIHVLAQSPCTTGGADVTAVKKISEVVDHAFASGDAAALAAVVAEDAVWMPPEEPTIIGRAAIETRYANLFRELHAEFTGVTHSLEVVEVRVCGNWAMSRGHIRLALVLPTVPQPIEITGKNVHTYVRQPDGGWLIASDIWNFDAPRRRGPGQ
ncbi:MAG: SgcJ/EcaC family oxidoreductase [Pseudomonas stutzeri]|nr:SgcJ/EcaC family oxidoreductase [Stutzerimonas stutzeri]